MQLTQMTSFESAGVPGVRHVLNTFSTRSWMAASLMVGPWRQILIPWLIQGTARYSPLYHTSDGKNPYRQAMIVFVGILCKTKGFCIVLPLHLLVKSAVGCLQTIENPSGREASFYDGKTDLKAFGVQAWKRSFRLSDHMRNFQIFSGKKCQ